MSYQRKRFASRFGRLTGSKGTFNKRSYGAALVTAQIQNKQFDLPGLSGIGPFAAAGLQTVTNLTAVTNTGIICNGGSLNLIPQGSSSSQREGRQVIVTGIEYNATVMNITPETYLAAPAAYTNKNCSNIVRLILVLGKQTNCVAPTVADVLDGSYTTDGINAHQNYNTAQKYRILDDKYVDLNPTGFTNETALTPVGPLSIEKQVRLKMRCNIPIEFNATTPGAPTIACLPSNNLFLIAIQAVQSTSATAFVRMTSRLLFVG